MEEDQWGKDPSVQAMRRVFAAIETSQSSILDRANISRTDTRLRRWREAALTAFESRWTDSARMGDRLSENEVRDLYVSCFEEILKAEGVT